MKGVSESEFPRPRALSAGGGRGSIGCIVFIALVLLAVLAVRPYVDFLWYAHDARHPEVFKVIYGTRAMLFSLAFVVAVAVFAFNLQRALGVAMVYIRVPESFGEAMVANTIVWVQRNAAGAVKVAALVLGLLFALGFSAEVDTYLRWRNGGPFGKTDPLFGRDLGFFVFQLPWWIAVTNFLASLFLLVSLASVGIYAGMQSLARLAKIELSRPAIRSHLSILFGLTILLYAFVTWLRVFEYGVMDSPQFTGAGYAAVQKLGVQRFLAGLLGVIGVATLLGSRVGKPYAFPIAGAFLAGATWLLGMVVYPATIQRIVVEPDKLQREGPYARMAIDMTRWAYGLDAIQIRTQDVQEQPSAEEIEDFRPTLEAMRLWDPEILRRTVERQQGLRPYYTFRDVDVDRYNIDGKVTPVMLAPRDVRHEGLAASARAWINTRLQYTHGFGVVMMAVNGADANGRPLFLIKDFPPKTPEGLPLEQPRLYFSDFRLEDRSLDDPVAIVGTKVKEFDYPIGDVEKTYLWTGKRGIPVSGRLARTALSIALGDGNLFVSGNIGRESRVLMYRNVIERARRVYPFLRFDSDPYITIEGGRIIWILDAYSVSDSIPYSARYRGARERLNYIRNSVKITIDAYLGDMQAYAVLADEPILKAYRRVFPNLVKDASEMPEGLRAHWRYPEDLFKLQADQLTQYHVTDTTIFINNSDAWEIPIESSPFAPPRMMDPYYVQIQLPGSKDPRFMLILPFTPRARPNMSGWLAAHCNPAEYGQLILFKYPTGSNLPGPGQMEALISQDTEIANINKLWNTDYSDLISGNLLVVPIANSVLYVKPLFLQNKTNPIPEMRKVVLALGDGKPVVADTYDEALAELFGEGRAVRPIERPGVEAEDVPVAPASDVRAAVREALELFDQADTALRQGDFAKFGELQRQAREKLRAISK